MRHREVRDGLTVRAIAGTYVVLLGFNVSAELRKGLLGFAIHRTDGTETESCWLRGMIAFPSANLDAGEDVPTSIAPIQKFRWGDYTAKPNHDYTYRVYAMRGTPAVLKADAMVEIQVRTEDPVNVGQTGHQVHFNRTVAASQAYVRRFGDRDPRDVADGSAHRWLSRGLEEALVAFIDRARDAKDSLHICAYEFQKPSVLQAIKAATQRKVKVEVTYDAINTDLRQENEEAIDSFTLNDVCRPRDAISAISHNKFIVHRREGKSVAVWTGSTNFKDGALYGQANVGHAVEDEALAEAYHRVHQKLWADPDPNLKDSRKNSEDLSPLPVNDSRLYPIFSPRTTLAAVTLCAELIKNATNMVCLTAPFALHDDIEAELDDEDDQFLKFALLDKASNVVERVHRTPGNRIASAARLGDRLGNFQAESLHHRGVYIHTKFILVDPLSDTPQLVTGSANFSTNSCKNNDENQLVIRANPSVADVYLGEFMRLYDHYAFRSFVRDTQSQPQARHLAVDDSWTNKYFDEKPASKDRELFSK